MDEPSPPRPDRRSHPRLPPRPETQVSCLTPAPAGGHDLAVSAVDVAQGGVCLILKESLRPGQVLEVTLENVLLGRRVQAVAVVVWCLPDGGHFRAGARFTRPLSYADVQAFV